MYETMNFLIATIKTLVFPTFPGQCMHYVGLERDISAHTRYREFPTILTFDPSSLFTFC